jgi:hypothetical protein
MDTSEIPINNNNNNKRKQSISEIPSSQLTNSTDSSQSSSINPSEVEHDSDEDACIKRMKFSPSSTSSSRSSVCVSPLPMNELEYIYEVRMCQTSSCAPVWTSRFSGGTPCPGKQLTIHSTFQRAREAVYKLLSKKQLDEQQQFATIQFGEYSIQIYKVLLDDPNVTALSASFGLRQLLFDLPYTETLVFEMLQNEYYYHPLNLLANNVIIGKLTTKENVDQYMTNTQTYFITDMWDIIKSYMVPGDEEIIPAVQSLKKRNLIRCYEDRVQSQFW